MHEETESKRKKARENEKARERGGKTTQSYMGEPAQPACAKQKQF